MHRFKKELVESFKFDKNIATSHIPAVNIGIDQKVNNTYINKPVGIR